ncbi:MAG: hypothetical protein D6806_08685, partial [Deltaproteobacteria bacterium]
LRTGSAEKLAALSARRYEKSGEWRLAADAWRRAGKPERAFELLHAQGRLHEAAELAEEMGRHGQAIELYLEAGDPGSASSLAERAGMFERAAELREQQQDLVAAAKLYVKAKKPGRAAQCYEKAGMLSAAAGSYREAGEEEKAAKLALELARETTISEDDEPLLDWAASWFERRKKYAQVAEILSGLDRQADAAMAYEAAGSKLEAARSLERAGLFEKAAQFYRELGRADDWLRLLQKLDKKPPAEEVAEVLEQAGRWEQAAKKWLEAGKRAEAIRIFREHAPSEAAALLAAGGDHAGAARLYLEAGFAADALEQARRAGDVELELEAARQMGDHLTAGRILLGKGLFEQAARHLQAIERDTPGYRQARLMLSECLERLGEHKLALEAVQNATEGLELNRDTLEYFYRLACLLESGSGEEKRRAAELFERIVATDIGFGDARERLKRLRNAQHSP